MNPQPSVYILASGVIFALSQKSYAYFPRDIEGQACRFYANKVYIVFALQLFRHKRRDQPAEVRAAARATYYHVRLYAVFIERYFAFLAYHRLVQKHVVEHRAENIAAVLRFDGRFHSLGNGAAERTARAGEFGEYLPARLGGIGRGGDHVCAVSLHYLLAVGFLLVRGLYHEHL